MPFDDAELDRLAAARDAAARARTHKKSWLDTCYGELQLLESSVGARIKALQAEGDALHHEMGRAFERSKEAFSVGDHGAAGDWSREGHRLKDRLRSVNAEKGRYIKQMQDAQAKFIQARDDYRQAKDVHEQAKDAFFARLEHLKAEAEQQRRVRHAQRASAAEQRQREARAHQEARAAARRERERAKAQLERIGESREFRELAVRNARRHIQFRDADVKVTVKIGFDRDFNAYVSDFIVIHRDPRVRDHYHLVIDAEGRELFSGYRRD